jgi:hypothetical protein
MDRKFLIPALAFLVSCGQAGIPTAPLPVNGSVILTTDPLPNTLQNPQCWVVDRAGIAVSDVVAADGEVVLPPGRYYPFCKADGYHEQRGRIFPVAAGVVTTAIVTLTSDPVPTPTTGIIWVSTNVPATIDSVIKYALDGSRTVIPGGTRPAPASYSFPADSALYVFWASADGYEPTPISDHADAGMVRNVQMNLSPTPLALPTTGTLQVASNPPGMRVTIYLGSDSNAVSSFISQVRGTNVVLEAGNYSIFCSDSSGEYGDIWEYASVNAGAYSSVVCTMPKKVHEPPRPTAAISVSRDTIMFGDTVTVNASCTNATYGFLSPLNIFTTGGSFTDSPFATNRYVMVCFGPGGIAYQSAIVSVKNADPILVPDTVRITFPDPAVSERYPTKWLWGQFVKLTGHKGPVQIRILVRYSNMRDDGFAIGLKRRDGSFAGYVKNSGSSCPVVPDNPELSGWYWTNVGTFNWQSGDEFAAWAYHGSLFSCYLHSGKWGEPGFMGIEFIRWK